MSQGSYLNRRSFGKAFLALFGAGEAKYALSQERPYVEQHPLFKEMKSFADAYNEWLKDLEKFSPYSIDYKEKRKQYFFSRKVGTKFRAVEDSVNELE